MADGDFTKHDFDVVFQKKFKEMTDNKAPVSATIAFVLGGQPGAGKTGLQEIMKEKCNGNLIILNGDEFRELHPDFDKLQEKYGKDSVDYTGKFSGQMTEALINKLKSEHYNVLVEGTLRTSEVPLKTCADFKAAGYDVVLGVIAVKPQISFLSTVLRYEKMIAAGKTPRATAKDKHDYVVEHIPDNLQQIYDSKLFDNILIYNRNGECLYDMSQTTNLSPSTIIQEVFSGVWTEQELSQFKSIGKATEQLMELRNAPELTNFKQNIFNEEIISSFTKKKTEITDPFFIEVKGINKSEIKKKLDEHNIPNDPRTIKEGRVIVKIDRSDKEKAKELLNALAAPKIKL